MIGRRKVRLEQRSLDCGDGGGQVHWPISLVNHFLVLITHNFWPCPCSFFCFDSLITISFFLAPATAQMQIFLFVLRAPQVKATVSSVFGPFQISSFLSDCTAVCSSEPKLGLGPDHTSFGSGAAAGSQSSQFAGWCPLTNELLA